MTDYETLKVERQDRVALVTFSRPDQLNAMNRRMQGEITDVFAALSADADIGAIVVTGQGRAFMAGADIKEYAAQSEAEFDRFQQDGARMYAAIEDNRKPVIAAVNGFALGGGFELVLCADMVLAAQGAKMGLPEIKLGLVPGGGGTQRGTVKLGRNRANFLLMSGAILPAEDFVAPGLVNRMLAPEALLSEALALAGTLAAEPADAIEAIKRLTAQAQAGQGDDLAAGLAAERQAVTRLYRSPIGQERIQAFAAKSAARLAADTKTR